MNSKCSQKWARPGMSSCTLFSERFQSLTATHRVREMAYSDIQAGSGLVCLCIVDECRLQAIIQANYPVLSVILLRFDDGLSKDGERGNIGFAGGDTPPISGGGHC